MASLIKCPSCGSEIELTEALRKDIEQEVALETEKRVKRDLEEKMGLELADLKKALEEKDRKMADFREQELKLREEKRKLEEKEKELALEVQRQLDEERKKTEEEVLRKAQEEHRLKDQEKEKVITDLKKALEDAQRKAQQGSQQTQGEVLELDLEATLKSSFPQDEIEPVGKGVRGADVRQTVKSQGGVVCGVILWESKRTKAWTDEWTSKLKSDLRAEGANIPVIVSETLPKESQSGMGVKDGVWVVSFSLVLPLAVLLRKNLLEVAYQKVVSADKGSKAGMLYEYVTGHEFRQQVEALVEVYHEMQEEINKEKAAFERIWKAREGQLKRFISSTANMCGEIQGAVGPSVIQIKGLELLELQEGK
jgi:hypothetical protein